jgi:hypothetical protein
MIAAIDTTIPQFNDALAAFIKFERVTIPEGLRTQGRLLGLRLVQFTPPKTRAQGRAAVKRDIQRAVRPLRPAGFRSPEIRRLIRQRDYDGLQSIFERSRGELKNVRVVRFSSDLHTQARDRRGRVAKDQRQVTPDADELRDYIRTVQAHVGRGKGGWAAGVLDLGGKVSRWIAEHRDAGRFEDHADQIVNAYIRLENKSEWASGGDDDRIVPEAIRSRTRAIRDAIAHAQREALSHARLAA